MFRDLIGGMSIRPLIHVLASVVCAPLITSCGGGGGGSSSTSTTPVSQAAVATTFTTSVVQPNQLTSTVVSSDSTTVTFSGPPPSNLQPGTVFISGGVARKVVSIAATGGNTVVTTTTPQLNEVFTSLSISGSVALTPNAIDPSSVASGISITPVAPPLDPMTGVVTPSRVGNDLVITITDQDFLGMKVNGKIDLSNPTVTVDYSLQNALLNKPASVRFTAGSSIDMDVSIEDEISGSKTFPLFSFTVPVAETGVFITVPVSLELTFEADGTITGGFVNTSALDFSVNAKDSGSGLAVQNNSTNNFSFKDPKVEDEVTIGAYVHPDVDVSVLKMTVGGFKNQGGVSVTADLNQQVTQQLNFDPSQCLNVTANAKVSASAYLAVPIRLQVAIYDNSWQIYQKVFGGKDYVPDPAAFPATLNVTEVWASGPPAQWTSPIPNPHDFGGFVGLNPDTEFVGCEGTPTSPGSPPPVEFSQASASKTIPTETASPYFDQQHTATISRDGVLVIKTTQTSHRQPDGSWQGVIVNSFLDVITFTYTYNIVTGDYSTSISGGQVVHFTTSDGSAHVNTSNLIGNQSLHANVTIVDTNN